MSSIFAAAREPKEESDQGTSGTKSRRGAVTDWGGEEGRAGGGRRLQSGESTTRVKEERQDEYSHCGQQDGAVVQDFERQTNSVRIKQETVDASSNLDVRDYTSVAERERSNALSGDGESDEKPKDECSSSSAGADTPRFSTFRQSAPLLPVRPQDRLRQKLEKDRGYELIQQKKLREKEVLREQKRKDRRAVRTTNYLQDFDDDDSDGMVVASHVVISSDESEIDEVHVDHTVKLSVRNDAKYPRGLPIDLRTPLSLQSTASRCFEPDAGDDDNDKKKKKKKKKRGKGGNNDSDEAVGRSDKNRKRKHPRSSSSDDNSGKRKKGKKNKSKKKRHRSSSGSASSDSEAERPPQPRPSSSGIRWKFLDTRGFDPINDFQKATIPFARERHNELFLHDQVYAGERPQVRVLPKRVLRKPCKDTTTADEFFDNIMFKNHDELFYGKEAVNKARPKRYYQNMRWSKTPENYFVTKQWKPHVSFVPLSTHRIDPTKAGFEQIDDEIEQQAVPEVHAEKSSLASGERTTEVLLEEMELDRVGSVLEKKRDIEEKMRRVRFSRQQARGETTREQLRAHMEQLWGIRLELEDVEYKRSRLKAKEEETVPMTEQQFKERKLDMLAKAEKDVPSSFVFFEKKLEIEKDSLGDVALHKLYEDKRTVFASEPRYWISWVDALLFDMKYYSAERVEQVFVKSVKNLDDIMSGTYNVPRRFASTEDMKVAVMMLLYRRMQYLVHSGRIAHAVSFMQAMLENLAMPSAIHEIFVGNRTAEFSRINESFEQYWNSRAPRIGDEGAILWRKFGDLPVEERPALYEEKELLVERQEMTAAERRAFVRAASLGLNGWQLWVMMEKIRAEYAWRPVRTSDDAILDSAMERDRVFDQHTLRLPNIRTERVQLFASEVVKVLGAKLPFELGESDQIARVFGGFPALPHLPIRLSSFLTRLTTDLIGELPTIDARMKFYAIRVLTHEDDLSRSGELTPSQRADKLIQTTARQFTRTAALESMWSLVLALQQAVQWSGRQKSDFKPETFITRAGVVWRQLNSFGYPLSGAVIDLDDPIAFALYASILCATLEVIDVPEATVNLLVTASEEKLVFPESTKEAKAFLNNISQPLSGPRIIKAVARWMERSRFFLDHKRIEQLTSFGLYQPCALYNVLNLNLIYETGQGPSSGRYAELVGTVDELLREGDAASRMDAVNGAFLVSRVMRIIERHDRRFHNSRAKLDFLLSKAIIIFPYDADVLRMYCDTAAVGTFIKRTNVAQKLRQMHEQAVAAASLRRSRLLAVARIYFIRRVFEVVTMRQDEVPEAGGMAKRVAREFESVAQCQREPYFWRLLIHLHKERNEPGKAFEAYTKAVKFCVWSRQLHLDMADCDPRQAKQVFALMLDKGVPMLADIDEAENMLEAARSGAFAEEAE